MGAMQEKKQQEREKKTKRGSAKNATLLGAFGKGDSKGGATWESCDAKLIVAVVLLVTKLGGACIFGLSRDEGAHMLTLLLKKEKKTFWYNGSADLSKELDLVVGHLQELVYQAD